MEGKVMNINHHLDEATLVSYTAGAMTQAMALVVACHISMCKECRERVAKAEAIGGLLLESLDAVDIHDESLAKLLSAIDESNTGTSENLVLDPSLNDSVSSVSSEKLAINPGKIDVPRPLQSYIGTHLESVQWKSILPGIQYYDLPFKTERGGVSRLLRIAPGKAMLEHTHDGNELTLVLQGSISDEVGRFGVGDIADLDEEIDHQPIVDSADHCICLVATDAPLKFNTLLGKIVQPITGF
jgi:putative transcriptional regulator